MTTPDPEHIDAVARVIDPEAFDVDSIDWLQRAVIEGPALDLLTSTDPAVHAAMLDALTRHGVLTEEVMNNPIFRERTLDPSEVRMVGQNGDATVTYVERWADQRRLVTSWGVTE